MRYLKPFNESNTFATDPNEVRKILGEIATVDTARENKNLLNRITIHPDGTVDVHSDGIRDSIYLSVGEKRLPIKFGNVEGEFNLIDCPYLTTLEGSPRSCKDFISTYLRQLSSLIGGPQYVTGGYSVNFSGITSLEGAPEHVGGKFIASSTKITSLEGSPKSCREFDCRFNELKNLIGGPENVETFNCSSCPLTSLEGIPKKASFLVISTPRNSLYDPRGLKDTNLEEIRILTPEPISQLFDLFHNEESTYSSMWKIDLQSIICRRFIDSLDYNYIRGTSNRPKINLFRLKEAQSELVPDWKFPAPAYDGQKDILPSYDFVDESGRVVDYNGDPI